ncbi:DUF2752 domain-containing protein [Streptacidiphilus sp. N1-12]|uniref:DUF2752 domain-containing protein n=2 Tax=Streptacidiphilus alkalitolerans TaxID=3342712 RepID=A0ABV6V5N9_9ACTN
MTAVPPVAPARTAPAPVPLSRRIREVLLRGGGAGAAAVAAAAVHSVHDPGVICPFRLLTGLPCPVCGSSTVFIELGSGHPAAALLANPFTVLFGLGLLFAPLGVGRRWRGLPKRLRTGVLIGAAVLSWCWQLHRLGLLSH